MVGGSGSVALHKDQFHVATSRNLHCHNPAKREAPQSRRRELGHSELLSLDFELRAELCLAMTSGATVQALRALA